MKLIFINTSPTSKIFGQKVNPWWFSENGFDVEFWDCSPLFFSNEQLAQYYGGAEDYRYIGPKHQIFDANSTLLNTLKTLPAGTAIFYVSRNLFRHVKDDWLLETIQNLNLNLYFQGFDTRLISTNIFEKLKNIFRNKKHKFLNRKIHPKVFFGCGSISRKQVENVYAQCEFISIPSPKIDWNHKTRIIEKDYIVFVDEGLVYAPDAKLKNKILVKNINEYYERMKQIFNLIETWTDLPIVIAASGKYIYQKNVYDREIIYGKTFDLMEYSTLILGHFSSALDYNLIIKKPIIQFDDIGFTDYSRRLFQVSFPLYGRHPVMTTKFDRSIFERELNCENAQYPILLEQYFKEKGINNNYLEIMANTLKKDYCPL